EVGRRQRAGAEELVELDRVAEGHAAGEQVMDELGPAALDRLEEEGVDPEQAAQVDDVLGEHDLAGDVAATEDPRRRVKALARVLTGLVEEAEQVDEVGAGEGEVDGLDPQGQAAQAGQV